MSAVAMLGLFICVTSTDVQEPEATSLFGKPLFAAKLSEASHKTLEDNLAKAKAEHKADPKNVDKYVWVGRRIAYLGRFREAIDWFATGRRVGLEGTNVEAKLLRHLGHRFISIRRFDVAESTLLEASKLALKERDEVEPDGIPNVRNTPIGTVHSNIYYHLGLAQYLLGDFVAAAKTYEESQKLYSKNADRLVSTAYWQALTYAKLGNKEKLSALLSSIRADLDVIENQAYLRLLLHFKGELSEKDLLDASKSGNDPATAGYGVAAWRLYWGRKDEAVELLRRVLKGEAVFAFGYIAAEAELKRMELKP